MGFSERIFGHSSSEEVIPTEKIRSEEEVLFKAGEITIDTSGGITVNEKLSGFVYYSPEPVPPKHIRWWHLRRGETSPFDGDVQLDPIIDRTLLQHLDKALQVSTTK